MPAMADWCLQIPLCILVPRARFIHWLMKSLHGSLRYKFDCRRPTQPSTFVSMQLRHICHLTNPCQSDPSVYPYSLDKIYPSVVAEEVSGKRSSVVSVGVKWQYPIFDICE